MDEKERRSVHWCQSFFAASILFFIAAVSLIFHNELGTIAYTGGYVAAFVSVVFIVLAVAMVAGLSEVGVIGEFGLFVLWVFTFNILHPEYVDMMLVGGSIIFLVIAFIGWIKSYKDRWRLFNLILTVMLTAIFGYFWYFK